MLANDVELSFYETNGDKLFLSARFLDELIIILGFGGSFNFKGAFGELFYEISITFV